MKRTLFVVGLVAFAAALAARRCGTPSLRVATFNIERFGDDGSGKTPAKRTDLPRLVEILSGLDADVIAVQEIVDPDLFCATVEKMHADGRRYRLRLSRCGGGSRMRVGFVYDSARVTLDGTMEFPELDPEGGGRCALGERPGLLGQFTVEKTKFELLAVHLAARGDEEHAKKRRAQWDLALDIVARRRDRGVEAIAILGDTNSTGFLDDRWGERSFLRDRLARADLTLLTEELPCSTYFRPDGGEELAPSMLDHVAATRGFPSRGAARVHGYCAETKCRPLTESPREREAVSDHCPVTVGNTR